MVFMHDMFQKIEMSFLMILCLSDEYVYVKHANVGDIISEDVSIFRSQCYEKGGYVKAVLTCTYTQISNE